MYKQGFLYLQEFNKESYEVWKEILSRWSQADYDDLTKRAERQATLELEWTASEYARKRISEYPNIGDQLDALYHAGVFPANMTAKIKETKDKYSK
jgi:phytoene dehydrogenase-like protein|tara:strand:+ start:551 stop:838 length:288 start_codon:yes stop_codon:yes gene_type:complete